MLDQSLESRLRSALQAEGDGLALTITAAELERRLALRRRPAPGRFASLGLAAAVTLTLAGLAAVAGGWFDPRPIVPAPTSTVAPSVSPSGAPSAAPSGPVVVLPTVVLPTLDELLARADRDRVVRAQAVGPSGGPVGGAGPDGDGIQPGMIQFAPVGVSGTYVIRIVCAGDSDITLGGDLPRLEGIVVPCDGGVLVTSLALEAGDRVAIRTTTSVAWRAVLEAPARRSLEAVQIAQDLDPPAGWTSLTDQRSERTAPSYADPDPSEPDQRVIVGLPNRERYRVQISCAGPGSITYGFGGMSVGLDDVPVPVEYLRTVAECDGGVHVDTIDVPLRSGAEFSVASDPRVAWHVAVLAETPPIAVPENDGTWTTSSASGPNLELSGQEHGISLPTGEVGEDVRIVVSCEGDGPLEVTTDTGAVEGERLDAFEVPCEVGKPATIARVYTNVPGHVSATFIPGGKPMWIMFATQVRR